MSDKEALLSQLVIGSDTLLVLGGTDASKVIFVAQVQELTATTTYA